MESVYITMMGISGSGKTSFLSAVHQTMMNTNISGYDKSGGKISVHFASGGKVPDTERLRSQLELDDVLITPGRFPAGTESTRWLHLTLCVNNERICSVYFSDYKGGAIGAADNAQLNLEDEDDEATRGVMIERMRQSNVLLVMADAVNLSLYEREFECRSKVGANRANAIFSVLSSPGGFADSGFSREDLCVLLLLTKSDSEIIPPEDKANNFFRLSQKALKMFSIVESVCALNADKRNWTFGVVPVSAIGEGNVVTVPFGGQYRSEFISDLSKINIVPYNIDVVMLFSVCWSLRDAWRKNLLRMKTLEAEAAENAKNAKGFALKRETLEKNQKLFTEKTAEIGRLKKENEKLIFCCDKIDEVFGERFANSINCRIEPSSRPVMAGG
ncbi:MAG: hypothetical protein LBI38_04155 [Oscillospiraceae bacterium]|jgi:GTPase SAR1 family protein|nr:hypothetical protein [Oscillospiraceae bacterium]